jgi:acyl carrier protein
MIEAEQGVDIEHKIRTIIAEQLHLSYDTVTPASTLVSLGADSLDIVELVMHLEETFDIEIKDEDAEALHTVQELISYVQRLTTRST